MPSSETFTFDRRAADFDRRAGLPIAAVTRIAAAVAGVAAEGEAALLDLGAGTGELGEHLARLAPPYLGLDLSLPMLRLFRRRAPGLALVAADAGRAWPLRDASVRLVFASRAAHLLDVEHVGAEALRVLTAGGSVVLGGVRRQEDSVRAVMRRRLHDLLEEHGVSGRRRRRSWRRLAGHLENRGFTTETRRVAEWPVEQRPIDSLEAWRGRDGLAGRPLAPDLQHRLLERLETWARGHFHDLQQPRPATEHYELLVARAAKDRSQKAPALHAG